MANTDAQQDQQDLEKVIDKKVKPIVEEAMQKFLGITIDELSSDITAKMHAPLLDIEISTKLPFKEAKKRFKNIYLKKLLLINHGNISETAKMADVDRRSIHRIVKEMKTDVGKIRDEMKKAYDVKHAAVVHIVEDVLDEYKTAIHPTKFEELYQNIPEVSKEIIDALPERQLTLKEAEEVFEREYLKKALEENDFNIAKASKKIKLRYETLHRKCKKLLK